VTKDAAALFFAILTVAVDVFVVAALVGALAVRVAPSSAFAGRVLDARDAVAPDAIWAAAVIALVTMLGSLYLSEIADYPPCKLCWFQRIAMYPLTFLLGIAAAIRDRAIYRYVLPLTSIGAAISIYHYQLERFPEQHSLSCAVDIPCTTVWIWKFHYISIPMMALSAFAAISVLVLTARSSPIPEGATA
jgi:disulfide bond formation protein DsbB